MKEKLLDFIASSERAFFIGNIEKEEISYCNQKATEVYHITKETKSFGHIFMDGVDKGKESFLQVLQKDKSIFFYNILTRKANGDLQLADLQIGVFDKNTGELFLEITPKIDNRMEAVFEQMDHASRGEAVLELDTEFSIIHGNKLFFQGFSGEEDASSGKKIKSLFQGISPEEREIFFKEAHETLEKWEVFRKNILISVDNDGKRQYSVELQRRTLDETGRDKVLVYLEDMENHRKLEEELDGINQYFDILQSMCNGLLYRFDIHNRILYRNEVTARIYNMPTRTENFPTQEWLERRMHPEDIEEFKDYIEEVVQGKPCSQIARLRTAENNLEYHKFIFKPLLNPDGSVKEMIGSATNIHHLKEAETELSNTNEFFHVMQSMWDGTIHRFDIHNRILYRSDYESQSFQLPSKPEKYPDEKYLATKLEPEEFTKYMDFMESVVAGKEGTILSKVGFSPDYKYQKITFKALGNPDGSVREMLGFSQDVTHLIQAKEDLDIINKQFAAWQELSEDMLFRVDIERKILIRHQKKEGGKGVYPEQEAFPEDLSKNNAIFPEDMSFFQEFVEHVRNGVGGSVELRMRSDEQTDYGYRRITWIPVENEEGLVTEVVGKLVDVQEVKALQERADYDALTNTLNKRAMLESTSHILARGNKNEKHALFFMDLDNFKYVNDNLGHIFGDFLLKELGVRLKDSVRFHDLVGRVG